MDLSKLNLDNRSMLHTPSEPWDFNEFSEKETHDLVDHMYLIMKMNGGIGLAANQIGFNRRVFVMQTDTLQFYAIFNPKIIRVDKNQTVTREGCLSFTDEFLYIQRPYEIKVSFYDAYGVKKIRHFSGIDSKCFQHELDHLDGITFHSR